MVLTASTKIIDVTGGVRPTSSASSDDDDIVEDDSTDKNSVVSKTRQELADLDDLDV